MATTKKKPNQKKKTTTKKPKNRPTPKAKKKDPQETIKQLHEQILTYESFLGELKIFVDLVGSERATLAVVRSKEVEAEEQLNEIRDHRKQLEASITGAKDSLFRLVSPGIKEYMPLFDRIEPTDEDKHGTNADEWRTSPISVLRLSPVATEVLNEADLVVVGQLQDRILAAPENWFEDVAGMTGPMAAAVADKLTKFIEGQ